MRAAQRRPGDGGDEKLWKKCHMNNVSTATYPVCRRPAERARDEKIKLYRSTQF